MLLPRYLVEAPPNICTPGHIAEAAQRVQQAAPDVFSLEVLEKEQCQEMNMGLYLGVSECSDEPPKFIHLTYKSPGEPISQPIRHRSEACLRSEALVSQVAHHLSWSPG